MIEIVLITLVTLNAFIAGFLLGKTNKFMPSKTKPTAGVEASSELITPKQKEVAEQIQKQEKAFREMLNYNAGVAYGTAELSEGVDT